MHKDQLIHLARQAQKLPGGLAGLPGLAQSLAQLCIHLQNMGQSPFRICLVGGFSHGKTHLLNEFLKTDIFPEGVLPATTVLTEVAYAQNPSLIFAGDAGEERLEPAAAALAEFCAGAPRADASGILRVGWPAPMLCPNTKIIDTPGLDDLLSSRANVAFAALRGCEAAIVLVSALAPLGLNERTFIESYLASAHMPRIALAVSFLDKLAPEAAARQLEHIQSAALAQWPNVEVWATSGQFAGAICGIDAMRARMVEWAADPRRLDLAARKYAHELAAILQDADAQYAAFEADLQGQRADRERQLAEARAALANEAEGWLELKRQFLDRGLALRHKLLDNLGAIKDRLYDLAEADARPDFESALRLNMQNAVAEISATLQKGIDADIAWLLAEIRSRYGVAASQARQGARVTVNIDAGVNGFTLPEQGLLTQILGQFLDPLRALDKGLMEKVVIFLPIPPIMRPIALQVARWLLEMGKNIDLGGKRVEEIRKRLDVFFVDLGAQTENMAQHLYEQAAGAIRERRDAWLAARQQNLAKANSNDQAEAEAAAYAQKRKAIAALLRELREEERP